MQLHNHRRPVGWSGTACSWWSCTSFLAAMLSKSIRKNKGDTYVCGWLNWDGQQISYPLVHPAVSCKFCCPLSTDGCRVRFFWSCTSTVFAWYVEEIQNCLRMVIQVDFPLSWEGGWAGHNSVLYVDLCLHEYLSEIGRTYWLWESNYLKFDWNLPVG